MTGREFHPMSGKPFAVLAAISVCAFIAGAADLTGGDDELFNPVTEWVIDYSAANGIPAGWRYDIPGDLVKFVSSSSGRALQVKNVNPGHALFTYNDPKIFERLTGTVLVEITLAFPKRMTDTTAKHQFYFGFAGSGDPAAQLIVGLNEHEVGGTISGRPRSRRALLPAMSQRVFQSSLLNASGPIAAFSSRNGIPEP